jgi:hypothetical protein
LTVTLSAPLPFSASLIAHGTLELQGFLISGEPCDIHLQRVLTGEHLQCEPALLGLKVTVCPGGRGVIESFNARLRDECLHANVFVSLADARRKIETWRVDYHEHRPHSSLGDRASQGESWPALTV